MNEVNFVKTRTTHFVAVQQNLNHLSLAGKTPLSAAKVAVVVYEPG